MLEEEDYVSLVQERFESKQECNQFPDFQNKPACKQLCRKAVKGNANKAEEFVVESGCWDASEDRMLSIEESEDARQQVLIEFPGNELNLCNKAFGQGTQCRSWCRKGVKGNAEKAEQFNEKCRDDNDRMLSLSGNLDLVQGLYEDKQACNSAFKRGSCRSYCRKAVNGNADKADQFVEEGCMDQNRMLSSSKDELLANFPDVSPSDCKNVYEKGTECRKLCRKGAKGDVDSVVAFNDICNI